jgi:hypothetical protein
MRRLAVALLAAGIVSVWLAAIAGTAFVLTSWALCAAGLLLLRRIEGHRRAATAGLGTLLVVIAVSLAGTGVTLGSERGTFASTPTLDPTSLLMSFGIVATFWAAAAFVLVHERTRREKLGRLGAVLLGFGLALTVLAGLSRQGIISSIVVGGSAPALPMLVGGALLIASFARACARIVRGPVTPA